MSRTASVGRGGAILGLALAVYVSGCGLTSKQFDCATGSTTVQRAWRDAVSADDDGGRKAVADYVVKCHALERRSEDEVRSFLGPPAQTPSRDVMSYFIGTVSMGFDSEYLKLTLDGERRVKSAARWQT